MSPSSTHSGRLAPTHRFVRRLGISIGLGFALIAVSLVVGMIGYHTVAKLSWIDSFLDASMILSGMGPMSQLKDPAAKIFAGCYALYSGVALLTTAGVILAPVVHRALHKFHLEDTGR